MFQFELVYTIYLLLVVVEMIFLILYDFGSLFKMIGGNIAWDAAALFLGTAFFTAIFFSFFAISNVFFGKSYEFLFVYLFLRIYILIATIFTINFTGISSIALIYLFFNVVEPLFIIYNYNVIVRGVLYRNYRFLGSNAYLHHVYSVS